MSKNIQNETRSNMRPDQEAKQQETERTMPWGEQINLEVTHS